MLDHVYGAGVMASKQWPEARSKYSEDHAHIRSCNLGTGRYRHGKWGEGWSRVREAGGAGDGDARAGEEAAASGRAPPSSLPSYPSSLRV